MVEALVEWILSKNFQSNDNIANYFIKKVQEVPGELEQVNQAVMRVQVLPIHQEMTHVWMMDSYTRTVRMQKVFLNN